MKAKDARRGVTEQREGVPSKKKRVSLGGMCYSKDLTRIQV